MEITNPLLAAAEKGEARRNQSELATLGPYRPRTTPAVAPTGRWLQYLSLAANMMTVMVILYLACCHMDGGPMASSQVASDLVGQIAINGAACSEHGDMFQDVMYGSDSQPVCECHPCFKGWDCSQKDDSCVLDVTGGSPHMFDNYWKANEPNSAVTVPGSYRMGYDNNGAETFYSLRALEQLIRRVHAFVGNAVTAGRHLVIGTGSTQLFAAAMYALTSGVHGEPALITAADPHYQAYDMIPPFFNTRQFAWGGNTSAPAVLAARRTIELVTTPNNPDGRLRRPRLAGRNRVAVFDLAYYWPHFTPIAGPMDEDFMMFTLSKLTGHAGSRIGWAIVKDAEVAKRMQWAVTLMSIGVAHESQLRAAQLLTSLLAGYEKLATQPQPPVHGEKDAPVFAKQQLCLSYAAALMQGRWRALKQAFAEAGPKKARLSLQQLEPPQMCTFFQTQRHPSPAYLWIRCERASDGDCERLFFKYGVAGRSGVMYGVGAELVRFSLLCRQTTFEVLLARTKMILADLPPPNDAASGRR